MKKEKDFECQHVKKKQDKSIYIYHLINRDLCICERCEAKLRDQVLKQNRVEEEIRRKMNGSDIMKVSKANGFLQEKDEIINFK